MYITITGIGRYLGVESFRPGQYLMLKKDLENPYDDEAIVVENQSGVKCGYVANSRYTVARGTHSAGYVYRDINDGDKAKVLFIIDENIIAEV